MASEKVGPIAPAAAPDVEEEVEQAILDDALTKASSSDLDERPRVPLSGTSRSSSSSSTPGQKGLTLEQEQASKLSALDVLVVGAMAGAFSKTITAPLDRVRIMFQVNSTRAFSFKGAAETAAQIIRESGPQGLWKGNTATLWRVVPFSGIQFFVWDIAHSHLKAHPSFEGRGPIASLLAGASAGVTATVCTYPLDLLRARQAVGFNYRNYTSACEDILRKEGARGLFKGLSPTVIGMFPYSAISFSTFDFLKRELRKYHGVELDADVPVHQRLMAGGICGAAAQLSAYPLHIVRRRMQVQHRDFSPGGSLGYTSTHRALMQIRAEEGVVKGLFKSVSLAWLKGPLTVGLAFVTNDTLKSSLQAHYLRHAENDGFVPLPGQGLVSTSDNQSGRQLHSVERLVCGGLAGSAAKTVIAPGDRVKILFQTDSTMRFTWKNAINTGREIFETQGVRGLWRGHGATLLRVAPYSATSFCVFDTYKDKVRKLSPSLSDVSVRFLAGGAAGMTATTLTYPLDLFRARMAAHKGLEGPYDGYLRAGIHVARTEGGRALFSGLRPTLLGIVPYSGITFCLFETFKAHLKSSQDLDQNEQIGSLPRLGAGALSGLLAQSATYPLDIVRRRMQVAPNLYRHEGHAFMTIMKQEGVKGLYKGLSMNWIKGPIAVGVSFTINDALRDFVSTM
eukprot:CAMPEP_0206427480 /NCGR_PEP_ID=MMETSP0324_2-20121206/5063_1 /ASSEMBLY_ACC=CAM_ASM_000836 /TAXON_ID=2866 /ORGANISM="Crypthecodinium cohnii, Strain Seligo" /LENGTH=678 /DNA_ID=CAMNT_0053892763 /DNA_START=650 /DNA_END=2686 /DNA_ORIENTATION=+